MIEIITTVMFLSSTFYGKADASVAPAPLPAKVEIAAANERLSNPITLEEHVRDYYRDTPILAEIARCESSFRHFGSTGKALRGEVNIEDIGVMQINDRYHYEDALMLGMNIYTLEGNLAYAKYLYKKEGTAPWISSSRCWQKSDNLAIK